MILIIYYYYFIVLGNMMRPQMTGNQQPAVHTNTQMYMNPNSGVGVGVPSSMGPGLTGPAGVNTGMNAIGNLQMQQRLGYPRTNNQRPPNVNVGPSDSLGNGVPSRVNSQNWQHIFMQQQQQQQG